MDEKHRNYCIRLGNPYYINESQTQYEELDISLWDNDDINNIANDNLLNNSKKFTN